MKNLFKNYVYTATYQLLLLILPVITLPYVSRVLLPTGIGINAWVSSVNSYFVMFAVLGLTVYAQREIATQRENKLKMSHTFWKIEFASVLMGTISLLVYLSFVIFYEKYTFFLIAYSLSILAVIFDVSWLFSGMEQFKILAIRNIIVKLLAVLFIFIFVKSTDDLLLYMLIQSGSILISNISLWPAAMKIVGRPTKVRLSEIFEQIRGSFQLFIPQISVSIYLTLNKIILGIFSTKEQVGFFDSSDKIIRMIFSLFVAVSTVVMPRVANMYVNKKFSNIQNLLKTVMSITLVVLFPLIFCLYLFSPIIINVLFGPRYINMIEILRLMTIVLPALAIANIMGNQILVPLQMIKQYTLSIVYGSLINLIIEIPLIILFKSIGATIAVICAESIVTGFQIKYSRGILNLHSVFTPAKRIIITGGILIVLAILLSFTNLSFLNLIWISFVLLFLYSILNYKIIKYMLKIEK
ncbi:oligosaccharide flippase family protein [Weissella paramesenteroides]|uniref:oligosaccharide flippase family protein n=1 Tax=Weissella paramesenteroides TaxID=1249 RepID=UPI002072B1AC|nr:oligosaccharide flippase family protein [Weissella paramesenteroides]MCM6765390.1 oligosaccharide flippase family protein [Weissella paramesenteroides]MCM6766761.1 oligosaccharide flippase family protein [Weissella paramesenteroides]MCM6771475.1 oligosaccharide flippase family protein [Weissella paramesenteroides]MCM6779432.1 oligosaccharide flippase family protein [Weissella paramesenteroides]MCM6782027.1 oligosaccharide flippase family protein [Weissella paramesenteroides]